MDTKEKLCKETELREKVAKLEIPFQSGAIVTSLPERPPLLNGEFTPSTDPRCHALTKVLVAKCSESSGSIVQQATPRFTIRPWMGLMTYRVRLEGATAPFFVSDDDLGNSLSPAIPFSFYF